MKVLVTGASGQLGHDVFASLSGSKHECIATDLGGEYITMDITDSESVMKTMGNTVPGWSSLMVSIWFVGGAVLLGLGIVGEYIGKIYREVKRRPRYIIMGKLL